MVDSLPFKNEPAVVVVKATAFEHLFNVEGDADKLDDKRRKKFTQLFQKGYFCAKERIPTNKFLLYFYATESRHLKKTTGRIL